MKIIFNDATELQVQSVTEDSGQLLIKTIAATTDVLRAKFSDTFATKQMTVQEQGKTIATYKDYTELYRLEEYAGSIRGVVMYQAQKTPEAQAEVVAASVMVAQIQAQSLTDEQALSVKAIYPQWRDAIGQTVDIGFKFIYEGVLYKTIQENLTIQEQYIPGQGTESLYTCLDETHAGTLEDPIPYNNNMELEEGKYYIQDEVTYICTRSTGQPVYNSLTDLVGLYVEVATETE